jgi:uncharacterized damage-inducible protein DinB
MSGRAKKIAEKIKSFNENVIAFVENLSDKEWTKMCEWEQWTVGVTARHIGAGHLAIYNLAGMIIKGEELPQLSMDQVHEMSKTDAREHADCTKAEALEYLRKNGPKMVEFVLNLSDEDLDRKGSMPAFGGEFTAEQFIEVIIFQNAFQHFDNMKSAVAR